ncbi:hypothetical protein GUITHDRAFT_106474 [Guillardia theta CCMP2712]|uniref:Uncharacterized protein n=1 Tax=Guillardia theta (strain CCMP2712) TaxID=905079 RepID=L1JHF7_GUITC|nr:hypothetical protein GUITHDRAFT_106474 [Guillardia theta CCMP2712]EKX47926.1 hypothetical protein GUITHDRAFT_106474 [Guillardia theta CCMP2712]|eukprot:XP_005834906.1 hypothetical protein GUITHDRAFT_106474 [Guillardia theta CCMP2712]
MMAWDGGLGILAIGAVGMLGVVAIEWAVMSPFDRKLFIRLATANDRLRSSLRNAMITFTLNVFPGGTPFVQHSMDTSYPPLITRFLVLSGATFLQFMGPVVGLVHAFFPTWMIPARQFARGGHGMDRSGQRGWRLWWFYVRHPLAIEGEGFGNGAGLAIYSAAESLSYPSVMYDKFHDMFHDKLWQDRLFARHEAPTARIMLVMRNGEVEYRAKKIEGQDEMKWIWKPVYATMGLGIVQCHDIEQLVPPYRKACYMLVEQVLPSFHPRAEWFRISTLWRFEAPAPSFGYCWRTFNKLEDQRVQTDIIGGHAVLLKGGPKPFIGNHEDYDEDPQDPACYGFYDARNRTWIDASTYTAALLRAYELAMSMHGELGKELANVGWDVMVREEGPVFLEFNINNGFLVSDHGIDQCEKMLKYYEEEFNKRMAHYSDSVAPPDSWDLGKWMKKSGTSSSTAQRDLGA